MSRFPSTEDYLEAAVLFPLFGLFFIMVSVGVVSLTISIWGFNPPVEIIIYPLRLYTILTVLWWLYLAACYFFTRKK